MKASYEAYMRGIKPSEEFCTALESKMKQAFYASKRRRNPLYIGVTITAIIMVAIVLTVTLNKSGIEDNIIQSTPVVADNNTNDGLSIPDDTAEPISDDVVQSISIIAMPMTEDQAIELVKQADPDAEKASQFWVYPDGTGAWVFYATGMSGAWFNGAFWYVTNEKSFPLGGPVQNVRQWLYMDGSPGIFTRNILSGDKDYYSAFVLSNGTPVELKPLYGLVNLKRYGEILYGMFAKQNYDYIFLILDGTDLKEVTGTPLNSETANRFAEVDDIINTMKSDEMYASKSIQVTDYLYFPAIVDPVLGNTIGFAGTLAVNLKIDGEDYHLYIWMDANGAASPSLGWEKEISPFEGKATPKKDIGLEIIEPNIKGAEF